MRINVGIRRRLAPLVDNNRRRIELLNSLLLSFPGTPILYYGDELGMGDNIYLGDRNGVRTPMQWNSDRNAGFSKCDPARLYFPVVMDPIYGYQVINVEAQLSDQSSLLHWTRNMIALRKLFQVFGRGSLKFLNPANRKILAYLRDLDRGDGSHETVLCVANLSRFAQPVSLDLADHAGLEPVEMLGYVPFPAISETPYAFTLAPYSFLWLELQPASAKAAPLLETLPDEPIEGVDSRVGEMAANDETILDLLSTGWPGLLEGHGIVLLESTFSNWLPRQRWFGAKSRTIQSVHVLDWVELPASLTAGASIAAGEPSATNSLPPALFFLQLVYTDGVVDTYQVPLAFSGGADVEDLTANFPLSIVASFSTPDGPVALHDATIREGLRQALLTLIERDAHLKLSTMRFAGDAKNTSLAEDTNSPAPLSTQPGEAAPGAAQTKEREQHESDDATAPFLREDSLDARASTALKDLDPHQHLPARIGSAEQSNTSILYGEQFILKLFRRLQPGENPDVEIGRFLTEVAHFPRIAPFLGEISLTSSDGEKTTIAMLQGLVANQGDGWKWFLDQLTVFFASIAGLPAPPESVPPSFLNERELLREALEHAGPSLEAAALLSRRTAEMHLALATPTDDPAFAAEPLTLDDLNDDARRIDAQITSTLEALKTKLSTLKDFTADDAGLLLSRRINLFARAHAITASTPAGLRIRIHGDYHLGQTLRVDERSTESETVTGDFVLLDFEGEPARPLAERRQKQSPLKDVAGMIRSFSYAAYAGLDRYLNTEREGARAADSANLIAWAILWQNSVSSEFLRAYRETIRLNSDLLPLPQQCQSLLTAYLLEKALYELLYELNNRPAWLRIPLTGILML
jgi:maltose alpha-D-glucosyltransferase/alpha-amylase